MPNGSTQERPEAEFRSRRIRLAASQDLDPFFHVVGGPGRTGEFVAHSTDSGHVDSSDPIELSTGCLPSLPRNTSSRSPSS